MTRLIDLSCHKFVKMFTTFGIFVSQAAEQTTRQARPLPVASDDTSGVGARVKAEIPSEAANRSSSHRSRQVEARSGSTVARARV